MKIKLNSLDAHTQQNILLVSAFFCFLILLAYMIFSAQESENKNQKSIEKIIEERQSKIAQHDAESTIDDRSVQSTNAITFTHDNHWWVRRIGLGDYFIHHPDCPCQHKEDK